MSKALFGAGCFWGVQYYFDQIPGVIATVAGYSGGQTKDPTYEAVCSGQTGHAEVVQVEFDPKQVSYATLLRHFFRLHDPTQLNRQGPDVGSNYRSAIFYYDEQQQQQAQKVLKSAQKSYRQPIVTEVVKAGPFYAAEDYHQHFTERTGRGACHVPYKVLASR